MLWRQKYGPRGVTSKTQTSVQLGLDKAVIAVLGLGRDIATKSSTGDLSKESGDVFYL